MNEASFIQKLMPSLKEVEGLIPYKIPDMPVYKGMKNRFIPKKPYDMILDYRGEFIAIECKWSKGFKPINRSSFIMKKTGGIVTNNQIENLMKHRLCFALCNVWISNKIDRMYILDRNRLNNLNVESIQQRRGDFDDIPFIQYKKGYDLTKFIEMIESSNKKVEKNPGWNIK